MIQPLATTDSAFPEQPAEIESKAVPKISRPRGSERSRMSSGTPARMTMPDKQSIYVTLHDISEGGCCVIRTGNLPLKPSDQVRIEVWNDDIQLKVSFAASVRWVTALAMSTKAGLRFVDSSVKTHRYIKHYLTHSVVLPA